MMTFDTSVTAETGSESSNTMTSGTAAVAGSVYFRLGELFLSDGNVRTTEQKRIPELAAMIESQGLLAALHVSLEVNAEGEETGRGAVEAGGRRYRALMLLVEQGTMTLHSPVECKVVSSDMAKEVSLAENFGQESMHPSDEYAAFQALIAEGKTVAAVGIAFGISELHVKRRLKLANVASLLMGLYRAGEITLDVMMAFASSDDQERQVSVWESLSSWEKNNTRCIKNKLAEDEIEQDAPRVKVIGLQNYLNAGGALKEDLFSNDDSAPALVDMGLVDMLVGEAMQAAVDAVTAEGWTWVRPFVEYGHSERQLHTQLPKQYREPTQAEANQRKLLEAKRLELNDKLDALNDDDDATYEQCEAKEEEIEAVEAQEAALEETLVDADVFDKSVSGAIVAITPAGIEIFRGMVERTEAEVSRSASGGYSGSTAKTKAPKPDIPESLMKNLTSHRTAAVQAVMLTNQKVSLAALANTLALSLFDSYVKDSTLNIRISTCGSAMRTNSSTVESSRAGVDLADCKELTLLEMPKDKSKWFAWFVDQPLQRTLDFLVYASAVSTDLIKSTDRVSAAGVELSNALGLDMSEYWTATPETYFNFVPKSKLAAIVREVGTEEAAKELEKMKKDEAIKHAVKHTEGKKWLPAPLRVQVAPEPVAFVEEEDDDLGADDE